MPRLVIPIGLPGCGKTTLINSVPLQAKEVVLSLDRFRKEILKTQYEPSSEPLAHGWIDVTGRLLLSDGYTIVLDATHITRGLREKWCRIAREYKASVSYVYFDVSVETVRKQNLNRPKGIAVPAREFDAMVGRFQPPAEDEPWDRLTVIKYDGKGGFTKTTRKKEAVKLTRKK